LEDGSDCMVSTQPLLTIIERSTNEEYVVTNYEPMIDRIIGDTGKVIKTEKEFEKEIAELCVKLKDTQSCDWKIRT
jgi:hypothetical protein